MVKCKVKFNVIDKFLFCLDSVIGSYVLFLGIRIGFEILRRYFVFVVVLCVIFLF